MRHLLAQVLSNGKFHSIIVMKMSYKNDSRHKIQPTDCKPLDSTHRFSFIQTGSVG